MVKCGERFTSILKNKKKIKKSSFFIGLQYLIHIFAIAMSVVRHDEQFALLSRFIVYELVIKYM